MRKISRLLTLAVASFSLFASQPSLATPLSASDLYQLCSSKSGTDQAGCNLYLAGFTSGMLAARGMSDIASPACLPANITGLQVKLIIQKALREHLDALNIEAMVFVGVILAQTFPCPKKP